MTPVPCPYQFPVRVYWEDTDAGGVVYYANYLRFFERARTEWLRALGIEQQHMKQRHGLVFVVTHADVRYLQPARLDDLLQISVEVRSCGRASVQLVQHVRRADTLLAMCAIRIGCVDDASLRPQRIPPDLLQAIG